MSNFEKNIAIKVPKICLAYCSKVKYLLLKIMLELLKIKDDFIAMTSKHANFLSF